MSDYFAAIPVSNTTRLCVGALTRAEAEAAQVDVRGYYLFLANEAAPGEPIQILASFFSPFEAARAAKIFDAQGCGAAA